MVVGLLIFFIIVVITFLALGFTCMSYDGQNIIYYMLAGVFTLPIIFLATALLCSN